MKVSKRQLKTIIKEEKGKLLRETMRDDYAEMGNFDRYSGMEADLYVNLTDEQENALGNLEAAVAACTKAGCEEADVMDTIQIFYNR